MKLNQLPNLRVEDFPSQQDWIGRLFTILNPFIQAVNQVFDQGIDFSTNIKAVTREYSINNFQSFSLSWPYSNQPPADLRVIKAQKGTQLSACILLPAWSYDSTRSLITVSSLVEVSTTGVASLSGTYKFKIRASV